jgi:predicted secreted protein
MATWDVKNDLINGDDLLLYLTSGQTVVAYATSVSVQVDSETIDTSSKFSCRWASNIGGRASYTISADALYCDAAEGISFDKLLEMMVEGEPVEWYIGEEQAHTGTCDTNPHTLDTTKRYYNGRAIVTSVSLEAGNNEIASCSISMTGEGEIQMSGKAIGEE